VSTRTVADTVVPSDEAAALRPVAPTGHGPSRRRGRSVSRIVAPLAILVVVVGVWTVVSDHVLEGSQRFLLPPPIDVVRVGLLDGDNVREILSGLWTTTQIALVGLALSIVIGVALAVLMSQSRWVEHAVYPYAVVLQTIPILAIVPLLGFWFGFDFHSRVLVCVLISIFPIITSTLFGLQSVDPGLHDLFSLHHATRGQRLRQLQFPAAVPAMVTGFKISAGLAVIGAIIADFFFRQGEPGIGRLIDVYRQRLATEQLLTALLLSSLVGLLLFWAFDLLGHWVDRRRTSRT
jgi:NitT/TauT family transport system permease protein